MMFMKMFLYMTAWPLRVVLSWVFAGVVCLRNKSFDFGLRVRSVSCQVVSIGNLSVGGTGKTSLVITYVHRLQEQGLKVAVLSRGYKGVQTEELLCVSDGSQMLMSVAQAGDEAFMLAQTLPGVSVYVNASRYKSALRAIEEHQVDVCVLDDGFQHRFLHRDKDIVLWHALDKLNTQHVMPWGRLREPLSSLKRADLVIVSKAQLINSSQREELVRSLSAFNANIEVVCDEPRHWVIHPSGKQVPLRDFKGKSCVVFCALGRPEGFMRMVQGLGLVVQKQRIFLDHYAYTQADEADLTKLQHEFGADYLICTEKDRVKLSSDFVCSVLKIGMNAPSM